MLRAYTHVGNHHKGLLNVQVEELQKVRQMLNDILQEVEQTFSRKSTANIQGLAEKLQQLNALSDELNALQMERILDNTSKTRLSILYYAIVGDAVMISKQNLLLLEIFDESFGKFETRASGESG